MPSRSVEMKLNGWGNFRPEVCQVYRPEKPADARGVVTDTTPVPNAPSSDTPVRHDLIARGLARSYGDSAVNGGGGVMLGTHLNRLLAFDEQTGVIECEAGVSLADIIAAFLPRGWFLPVTPGTKYVTVGGAIAADVHGKNHHVDGTFGNFVQSLTLLTAAGDIITCSPEQDPDAFWATIGGMGLTGIILTARIRLLRVETSYIKVRYQKAPNLDAALEMFSQGDRDYRYSVAWIDCLASGPKLGRSVLMRGDHCPLADLRKRRHKKHPLIVVDRRKKKVPFNFPGFALNRKTVKLFNWQFYLKHPRDKTKIVDYDAFFYPLDGILQWNRIYGKRGFIQYQALLPNHTSRAGLVELLEKLSASGNASFLAVLKTTGPAGNGVLSFPFPGHTLALDLPNTGDRLVKLVEDLDRILLKHEGRLYLAKDSLMTRETFAAMYPQLPRFREIKSRLDPAGRFSSTQARRVGIV